MSEWSKVDERRVDSLVDRARQGLHCSLFCGGVKCKHESWETFIRREDADPAVEGLNSSWVTENVIASQRLSTSLFIRFPLIQQFKANNVNGIFNLQEKGEHSSCGPDGIYAASGYSYDGEKDLMRHGVRYYEFPWPDMTAPNNDIVLRAVQVMDHHIRNSGKVLVHCHAGLGRTGLMIACYLLLAQRMTSEEAIALVRRTRKGSVQTAKQVQFIIDFEKYLRHLALVFPSHISDSPVTLPDFIQRQRALLHGEESKPFRFIPRHTLALLSRAAHLIQEQPPRAIIAIESMGRASEPVSSTNQAKKDLNSGAFDSSAVHDCRLLVFLALEWFRQLNEPVLSRDAVDAFSEFARLRVGSSGDSFELIERSLPRFVRHTVAFLLSFVDFAVQMGNLTPAHRLRGVQAVLDAVTLGHPGGQNTIDGQTRDLLIEFGVVWCSSVGGMYFGRPGSGRVVDAIAMMSTKGMSTPIAPITREGITSDRQSVMEDSDVEFQVN